jgi:hypothetical protein
MTFLYISLRLIDSLKMYEMGDKENHLKKLTKVNFNEIKIKTFPKPNISNNKLLKLIPPHTQFSPFALIDYTRAITPIRGRPYGDFCRAFDAEEGRSPLFFSICNTPPEPPWIRQWLSTNLFLRISTVYSTPRHNIISFKLNKLFCGSLCVCNRSF